jgi:hypothetical protein
VVLGVGPKRVLAVPKDLGWRQNKHALAQAAAERLMAHLKADEDTSSVHVAGHGIAGRLSNVGPEDEADFRRLAGEASCDTTDHSCTIHKYTLYGGYYYLYMADLLLVWLQS